jgi:beta-glucosidase
MTTPAGYKDASLSVDARVADLLSRMTLKEKVGQINQRLFGWKSVRQTTAGFELTPYFMDEVATGAGMGALYGLFRADPWSGVTWANGIPPADSARVANQIQKYILDHTRLGIPVLLAEECPHGQQALGGTLIPTNLGTASTWNPDFYAGTLRLVAAELRCRGAHLGLISVLDMLRDPRWGRSEECYGEDPHLAACFAVAATRGLQGTSLADLKRNDTVVAVVKHFCAQGAGAGGHNAAAATIGERELREIHLPAARAAFKAGAQSCMAAYNEIDGLPCNGNKWLLSKVLREEWGFEGMVMADGYAIDNLKRLTGDNPEDSGTLAIEAGVDLSLWDTSFASLESAVRKGKCSEATLDRAVARVLRIKFMLGLFENPYADEDRPARIIGSLELKKRNLRLASESLVLLKNEDSLLPLRKDLKRIAVIGPNADNLYNQLGDYTPVQAEGTGITVLQGIRAAVSPRTELLYAKGCGIRNRDRTGLAEAVEAARRAEVALVVLGGSSARDFNTKFDANGAAIVADNPEMDCGEGLDVASLDLGGVQDELIRAVVATGTPTVVVLIQGRPHSIPWIAEHVKAILCAWYPGPEGGQAIAEALFGDTNPSGRLPVSIPKSSGQLPLFYNHKVGGDTRYCDLDSKPLFPFGFGLSYTEFTLSNLRLDGTLPGTAGLMQGARVHLAVDLKNTGACEGAETVQLYIQDLESSVQRRVKELKAFAKITLKPAETKTVSFSLGSDELGVWNADMHFSVEPGNVRLIAAIGSGVSVETMMLLSP